MKTFSKALLTLLLCTGCATYMEGHTPRLPAGKLPLNQLKSRAYISVEANASGGGDAADKNVLARFLEANFYKELLNVGTFRAIETSPSMIGSPGQIEVACQLEIKKPEWEVFKTVVSILTATLIPVKYDHSFVSTCSVKGLDGNIKHYSFRDGYRTWVHMFLMFSKTDPKPSQVNVIDIYRNHVRSLVKAMSDDEIL